MNTISFKNQRFESKYLILTEFGGVLISTTELNDKLMTEDGEYVSKEACYIDEKIFFFVEKIDMLLSDEVLSEKVYRAVL